MNNQAQRRGFPARSHSKREHTEHPIKALDAFSSKPLGLFGIVGIAILIAISTATIVLLARESGLIQVSRVPRTEKSHGRIRKHQVDTAPDLLVEIDDASVLDIAEKTPPDTQVSISDETSRTKICAFGLNPRQGSIFHRQFFNNNRVEYYEPPNGKQCKWGVPRVRTIPYVKCCTSLSSVHKAIPRAMKLYDIVIVTGDEYCAVQSEALHYRQYFSSKYPSMQSVDGSGQVRTMAYLPLGPRVEFGVVKPERVFPPQSRKYLFNFMGSLTSPSRKILKQVVQSETFKQNGFESFWHDVNNWHKDLFAGKYLKPEEYKQVLLDSKFTLCPPGHNPDSYRIFESCETGSIPVFVMDDEYQQHECQNAYQPFLDANAPFVFLKSWNELEGFLTMARENSTFVEERYVQVKKWYWNYMENVATNFEKLLMSNYGKRMESGRKVVRGSG